MSSPRVAAAEDQRIAIGFSNLVSRIDGDDIGLAKAEYRVLILEAMRAAKLNAVGAESLVFGRDDDEKADVVLGGTVVELECQTQYATGKSCRIAIAWEVLNRRTDEVIYRALTRDVQRGIVAWEAPGVAAKRLVHGALSSLLARPRFRALLAQNESALREREDFRPAQFRSCEAPDRELPGAFEEAADATVLLKNGTGFGSGFFLGSEGLVLTAAHVVAGGAVDVHERSGKVTRAKVVRVSRAHDVALLSIADGTRASFPCLRLDVSAKKPGTDVYAIGVPARQSLAFSLTRGIVSGVRTTDDTRLIQTDASISPGNSGGPLLDRQARVLGVVSRKLAGGAVEGIAFGVAIEDALGALGLEPGAETAATLLRPAAGDGQQKRRPEPVADVADAYVSVWDAPPPLSPPFTQQRRTSAGVIALRVGGYVLGGLGLAVAGLSYSNYSSQADVTRAEYESFRWGNDVGWAAFFVGVTGVVTSYLVGGK
jgi:S1-C subfamily serine protease